VSARQDWFRNTEWSAATRNAFWKRLERSRSTFHKAQYLRIQALELQHARPAQPDPALELLEALIARYPHESQLAMAQHQRASCLLALGDPVRAFEAFRAALDAERSSPGLRTGAVLDYAAAVVRLERADLYGELLTLLDEFRGRPPLTFPATRYRFHGLRAVLLDAQGQRGDAEAEARAAESARAAKISGFRYHQSLGLVEPDSLDERTTARITELAGA
jgi:hypothetical protein